ncbi:MULTISPECIES: DNA cytosine methyltransferase [Haloferax]|uniref:DNA (cytosine-5-)-methyltransferase n=2 Tax=Haloferax TaxID=2251 RepID=A0A6G1Z752_9EURY|nr:MULTISPECIES: DNA (cytosine-5-)-methyltransferase [Haloferax]KAB1184768.1 DNA (cytosine-5-)-methyltransferase [Haloferax sp. CBA1149]MRW82399.1 DNA (cytosine-5-)-methyltransferase [Haloferax marinisediminis]
MPEAPTAVDLFCGGGGFSEGLRQAGFDITHAVDIESKACATYRLNHPDAEVIEADVLDTEPEDLPNDIDLLFGSPPCTEFSWAKSGGGGDIEAGMKLVKRFLYFVVELDPDYWIMENVPRLDNYLPETVEYEDIPWLDREGTLEIEKHVLACNEYGASQRRNRLFSGQFPVPESDTSRVLSFGEVREHFPRPVHGPTDDATIADPIYDELSLPESELTDHFYNSHLTNREAEEIRVRKEDHSFYGKMQFPDDPDVPSRTVLATNRRVARETLVMEEADAPEGLSRFRKPTIREIATIQGFPITYQFTGTSQAQKWRRVGDAVPVPTAFRIGQALRESMGLDPVDSPDVRENCPEVGANLNERDTSWKGRRRLSISRNFRHHVPVDNKQSFRVDLETDKDGGVRHPLDDAVDGDFRHPVEFEVVLYRGYSTDVESTTVDFDTALKLLDGLLDSRPELHREVEKVIDGFVSELGPQIPDASTLQAIRSRRHERDEPLEYNLLSAISDYDGSGIVDQVFPQLEFDRSDRVETPDLFGAEDDTLPVRVLLKLVGANYLAYKLNYCGAWVQANRDEIHVPEEFEDSSESITPLCGSEADGKCVDDRLRARYLSNSTEPRMGSTQTD